MTASGQATARWPERGSGPAQGTSALLVMDMQIGVLERYSEDDRDALLEGVSDALTVARASTIPVIYVRLAFRPQTLDVSSRNRLFFPLVGLSEFTEGTEGTRIHPGVAPEPADLIIVKKRASAFSGTDLAQVTSALDTRHLVLSGLTTSGAILSTLRDASDRDYELSLLSDACMDSDPEVHRFLCERVFPAQATVITVGAWADSLAES